MYKVRLHSFFEFTFSIIVVIGSLGLWANGALGAHIQDEIETTAPEGRVEISNHISFEQGPCEVGVTVLSNTSEIGSNRSPRVFYPLNLSACSKPLGREISSTRVVIIWGNGIAGVSSPDNYDGLFNHWVSYGFTVVQERSSNKFDGSKDIPYRTLQAYLESELTTQGLDFDSLTLIAAGKSRGGNQAVSFATSKETRNLVDGVICIAGCGLGPLLLFPPRGTSQPSLYVTGDADWAAWKVRQAYYAGMGQKYYFERSKVQSIGVDPAFGTHLGHDRDPLLYQLTTNWIRCYFLSEELACEAIVGASVSDSTWAVILRDNVED